MALTDNSIYFTNFAQPGNFTTLFDGPQNLEVPNSGIDVSSVIITFDTYLPFTIDTNNTTVSDGNNSLTISGVTQSSVSLSNLSIGITYSGYQLTLQSSSGQTAQAVAIGAFSPAYPTPKGITPSPGETDVTISYNQYTAFTPNNAIINDLNPPASISISNVSNTQMFVSGLSAGTTYTCSIILTDGFLSSLPSAQITFTTTSPPPPGPDPPIYQSNSYLGSGTGGVVIDYSPYSSFTPTSGVLSVNSGSSSFNGTANSTQLTVYGLADGTTYTDCTFTISDGISTSPSSTSFTINTF